MWHITKEWTFDAAHCLPHHDGKCKRPHGHTYRVEVSIEGGSLQEDGPKAGMVVDFGDVSAFWKTALEPMLDHQDLNQTLADVVEFTTAEEIARFIYREFAAAGFNVGWVRVWETPTGSAVYQEP